jgi:hypothetical protein
MPQRLISFAACTLVTTLGCTAGSVAWAADASTKGAAKSAKMTGTTSAAKKAPPAPAIPEPTPDQQKASELVYYGVYECEFNQTVSISPSQQHLFYVDVKNGKSTWLMKPVLSTTGAVRLEDIRGETLMVQIASKSMLLNTKTGHRIVDACISPRQRDLMEAAKAAKADSNPALLGNGAAAPAATGGTATTPVATNPSAPTK